MQIGMVGLGRMGANMVRRLLHGGHTAVVHDLNPQGMKALADEGATPAASLDEFVAQLEKPRAAWIMVPAGKPTEETVSALAQRLESGDVIIDGGNSYFKDDIRRAGEVAQRGIDYLDVGVSGGIWGRERGYCLMIGGPEQAARRLEPIFRCLAPGLGSIPRTEQRAGRAELDSTAEEGYLYCGPAGAGHFIKMVHNGIEYGLMQSYAEGLDILKGAGRDCEGRPYCYDLNVADVVEVWRRGSVIGSWLLDLTAMALAEDTALEKYTGYVQDSGEGRWTVMAAVEEAVPADVLTTALYVRFRSRRQHTFAEKVLSAMRQKFGGHIEKSPTGE